MRKMIIACFILRALIVAMVCITGVAARAQEQDISALNEEVVRLQQSGQFGKALPLAKRVVAAMEQGLPPEHPNIAIARNNLGLIYQGLGRYAEAEALYKKARPVMEKALGSQHVMVGMLLSNLGELYRLEGRTKEAEPNLKRGLAILEKSGKAPNAQVATVIGNLALVYGEQGRLAEAEETAKHSLAKLEKSVGPHSVQLVLALTNIGELQRQQGHNAEAEATQRRALVIAESSKAPNVQVGLILSNLGNLYHDQERFIDAEAHYKRALAILEKTKGPEQLYLAMLVKRVAFLYQALGRFAEAETFYTRSIAFVEKLQGPDGRHMAESLMLLGNIHYTLGRFAEAEAVTKRSIAISAKIDGLDHPNAATAINNLGLIRRAQGRYREAEELLDRHLAIREKDKKSGPNAIALALNNIAFLYQAQGRYVDAERLLRRTIELGEKSEGNKQQIFARALGNLAELYRVQGRFQETLPLHRQSLEIYKQTQGPDHPDVAMALSNLALVYANVGQLAEAEPLLRRSLQIREKTQKPDHPDMAAALNNLATVIGDQGRNEEAKAILERSLTIGERSLGPDHPDVVSTLVNLAGLHIAMKRYTEAEAALRRSLIARQKVLGLEHPETAITMLALAIVIIDQERFDEAEPLLHGGIAAMRKSLDPDHPRVTMSLGAIARLAARRGDFVAAEQNLRQATAIIERRSGRGGDIAARGTLKSDADQFSAIFDYSIAVQHRLSGADGQNGRRAAETFMAAQLGRSTAAAVSLAQMAARSAKGSSMLGQRVRERQDAMAAWDAEDKALLAILAQAPDQRSSEREKEIASRMAGADTKIAEIDAKLAGDFPEYAALAVVKPVSVADVKAVLEEDEALVTFLDTTEIKPFPEGTFIWVVTKDAFRWAHSPLGTTALKREVAALRCGLDASARLSDKNPCAELMETAATDAESDAALPFDSKRAHALYKSLFGGVEDIIARKHLLIVPSGPLTTLPFQVLVSKPPISDDYRSVRWLLRDHALTVLPAVSSLTALRRIAKTSQAERPYIGFGNPLLEGNQGHAKFGAIYKESAEAAKMQTSCAATGGFKSAILNRGSLRLTTGAALVDPASIKRQAPLPETADELCAVGRDLRADLANVYLGKRATEAEIKRLSEIAGADRLSNYRIVHFATHGLLAGQLRIAEPGLLLTPPEEASQLDDGFLSASEIAALKFDADWVILSACNTAGGAGDGAAAEAFSGLARAFFYAGARTMLVSHWAVDSDATVGLITKAVGEIALNKAVGRSEALRRAMLEMVDRGQPHEAHPSYWAPFVVVGEGGAGR